MKYVDEYRDESAVKRVLDDIRLNVTRPWTIMEICGGQGERGISMTISIATNSGRDSSAFGLGMTLLK